MLGTFLLSIEKPIYLGKRMKIAMERARSTGKLDHDDAVPLAAPELQDTVVPKGYSPHLLEFIGPLVLLIVIAVGTFIYLGTPKVEWAFGIALLVAVLSALARGMTIKELVDGVSTGMKSLLIWFVILSWPLTSEQGVRRAGGAAMVRPVGDAARFALGCEFRVYLFKTIA